MGQEKHLHPLAASENIIFAPKYQHKPMTYVRMVLGAHVTFIRPCLMTFSVYTPTYIMTFFCLYAHNGKVVSIYMYTPAVCRSRIRVMKKKKNKKERKKKKNETRARAKREHVHITDSMNVKVHASIGWLTSFQELQSPTSTSTERSAESADFGKHLTTIRYMHTCLFNACSNTLTQGNVSCMELLNAVALFNYIDVSGMHAQHMF